MIFAVAPRCEGSIALCRGAGPACEREGPSGAGKSGRSAPKPHDGARHDSRVTSFSALLLQLFSVCRFFNYYRFVDIVVLNGTACPSLFWQLPEAGNLNCTSESGTIVRITFEV